MSDNSILKFLRMRNLAQETLLRVADGETSIECLFYFFKKISELQSMQKYGWILEIKIWTNEFKFKRVSTVQFPLHKVQQETKLINDRDGTVVISLLGGDVVSRNGARGI